MGGLFKKQENKQVLNGKWKEDEQIAKNCSASWQDNAWTPGINELQLACWQVCSVRCYQEKISENLLQQQQRLTYGMWNKLF